MLEAASSLSDNKIVSRAARNIMELKQQWREEEGTCSCNWRAVTRFSQCDFFFKEKRKDNQRLLGASSWMNWIVNEHGCKVPLLLNFVIKFRYCWQPNVEDYHLCIYSNSGRLEKHSVLKFICFKLLGHCNIFTFRKGSFLVFFYISWLSLCVG